MMLHESFKKKSDVIGKNMESIKKFKNEVNLGVEALEDRVIKCETNCDGNHSKMKDYIDKMGLKFAENTVDLTSAGEGFQREIERI